MFPYLELLPPRNPMFQAQGQGCFIRHLPQFLGFGPAAAGRFYLLAQFILPEENLDPYFPVLRLGIEVIDVVHLGDGLGRIGVRGRR